MTKKNSVCGGWVGKTAKISLGIWTMSTISFEIHVSLRQDLCYAVVLQEGISLKSLRTWVPASDN